MPFMVAANRRNRPDDGGSRIGAAVEALLERWSELWGVPQLTRFVRVELSQRLKRAAGRCFPDRGAITLNERFLQEHPEELGVTLCHEAAHVAAWLLHGRSIQPHGPEWQRLMTLAGFPADRTCAIVAPEPSRESSRRPVFVHRCPECGYTHRDHSQKIRWACPLCARRGRRVPLEVTGVVPTDVQ